MAYWSTTGQRWGCMCGTRTAWYVVERNCNYSAFNGYKWTWSPYSQVRCATCGRSWRTKAAYVRALPDTPPDKECAS